jgi:hypothetical protein
MTNPQRGEVQLNAGKNAYTLVFNTNAICALENALDAGIGEIMPRMGRLSVMRAMLWAGLLEHHKIATPEEVGAIVDEAGAPAAIEAINRGLMLAFPKPDQGSKRKNV